MSSKFPNVNWYFDAFPKQGVHFKFTKSWVLILMSPLRRKRGNVGANVALGHKIFPSKCISQGDRVRRSAGWTLGKIQMWRKRKICDEKFKNAIPYSQHLFEVVLWMYLSLSSPLSLTRHYPMESTRDLCIGAAELIPSIPKSIWSKSLWRLVRKTQGDRRHQQHGYGLHRVVHRARTQPPSNFLTSICWFIARLESEFFHLKPSTSQRHLNVFSNISAIKYLNNLCAFSYMEKVGKDILLMKIIVGNRKLLRILKEKV